MGDKANELREALEAGGHDPEVKRVSLTMALLAVFASAVALMSHRSHTEEIVRQNQASDQWSYMQAKNIRMHTYSLFADTLGLLGQTHSEAIEKKREEYSKQAERYRDEVKEIEKEARHLEQDRDIAQRRADRFDIGEVFLEVALVLASLTLLTRRNVFWALGLFLGVAGMAIAASGFAIRLG